MSTVLNVCVCVCIYIYIYALSVHLIILLLFNPIIGLFIYSFFFIFQLQTAGFKAYCAILVRRSNFCHQASPRVSTRDSTQQRKVELWARNVR